MTEFPFTQRRPGQDTIIGAVSNAVKKRGRLMVQASTGMGKTAAVLHATLNSAEEAGCRILFVTAKHTHQNIVYDTLERINSVSSENTIFTGVNGKRSMCLFDNKIDASVFTEFCRAVKEQGMCDYYKNTFSKSRDVKPPAIEALNMGISDPQSIIEASEDLKVCPYEISLLNARKSKVIVANYSHVFDSGISKGFFSRAGIEPENTILIVDEAHNLPDRIIDMNSFSISAKTLERAYKEASASGFGTIARKIDRVIGAVRDGKDDTAINLGGAFDESDLTELDSLVEANEKGYNVPASFTLKNFVSYLLKADESYIVYLSTDKDTRKINISSLDPSDCSSSAISSFHSAILISGTFQPMDMFAKLLGIDDATRLVVNEGVIDRNRLVIAEEDVTSKFSDRESQYVNIAGRIDGLLENFRHNMIVFFPSYAFIGSVYSMLKDKSKVIREEPNMTREKKHSMLSEVLTPGKSLFAVIGGNFSESIGVKNNSVRLIAVVGIPFEPPSVRLKALQGYYDRKFGNGFEYAQVLPSMIKTMQAAGRGIRSSMDKGVVLLMDSRYRSPNFRKYLPSDMIHLDGSPMNVINERGFN